MAVQHYLGRLRPHVDIHANLLPEELIVLRHGAPPTAARCPARARRRSGAAVTRAPSLLRTTVRCSCKGLGKGRGDGPVRWR